MTQPQASYYQRTPVIEASPPHLSSLGLNSFLSKISGTPGSASPNSYSCPCVALSIPKDGCPGTYTLELVRSIWAGTAGEQSLSWLPSSISRPKCTLHTDSFLVFTVSQQQDSSSSNREAPQLRSLNQDQADLGAMLRLEPKVTRIAHCPRGAHADPHT